MSFKYKNAVVLSKLVIIDKIKKGDTVIDATCGNGHDTLFLSEIVGKEGMVIGFDIQKSAINNTDKFLKDNNAPDNYILINDGHEKVDEYIDGFIMGAVFNLGYLPGGDHNIVTTPSNTITAISKILRYLLPGGIVVIVSYYGHTGGSDEKSELIKFLNNIDSKEYTVTKTDFINQSNCPPVLFVIEKC